MLLLACCCSHAAARMLLLACCLALIQLLRVRAFESHSGRPHTTTDPLMCVGAALSGLQTIVSRNLHPIEAGVVSTTFVRGGSAYNIIPQAFHKRR
jgi:metal-dependent amidase/aminoacylase/carboxypeptidase family protein